jgi:hypothetical protein
MLRDADGHSMMTGRNEVSHKLIPPAKKGDPYKAVIIVGSQSRYSIQRVKGDEESEEQAARQRTDHFGDEAETSDLEVYDSDLVGPTEDAKPDQRTAKSASEKVEKTVTRQADQQQREYELVYQDGKWMLITPLDPETEQSIENAFKRALDTQI